MKLQMKLLLFLALLFVAIAISFLSTMQSQKESVRRIQSLQAKEFIQIFSEIVTLKLSKVDTFIYDYTYWSEMVDFVTTRDSKWAQINITEPITINQIDYAYVITPSGESIYYHQSSPKLPNLEKIIHAIDFDFSKPVFKRFFIRSDAGPIQIFIAPIQPSEDLKRKMLPKGYMVVGKVWTKDFIQDFAHITNHQITLDTPTSSHYDALYPLKGSDGKELYRIGITLNTVTGDILNQLLKNQMATLLLISSIGISLFGLVIYQLIILPLRSISAAMNSNDSSWLKPLLKHKDEFGSIAQLIHKFFIQKKELSEHNRLLEQRVKERTTELETINHSLDERVKAEILRRHEQEQIMIHQSRFAAMGEMVGNIAHQWRQPLNAVSLLLQNIIFAYENNRLDQALMDRVNEKGNLLIQNMSNTIDDFRNFFKPNKNKELFNVSEQLKKALHLLQGTLEHNLITLTIDTDEDFMILGYPNEFSQVILNLISNAKDALIEQAVENKRILIHAYKSGSMLILSIEDNGGGISQEISEHIFDPYFTTKEEGKGSGIGLYMSKVIIETNMNGKLSFKNSNEGSLFTLELPYFTEGTLHASL